MGIAVADESYTVASRDDLTALDGSEGSYSEALEAGRKRADGRTQVVRSSEVVR